MRTSRFGAKLRKLADAAIKSGRQKYECPKCGKKKVVRKGNSKWKCKGCDTEYAGGAYSFTTEVGVVAKRMIKEYKE